MNIPCLARNISHNTSLFKNLITRNFFQWILFDNYKYLTYTVFHLILSYKCGQLKSRRKINDIGGNCKKDNSIK